MTWIARRHDLAPTLVGAELAPYEALAGEAGHTADAVTARFDLFAAARPDSIPRMTAFWVSTVGRDDRTRSLLTSVQAIRDTLDALGDDPVDVVPDPGDIVPDPAEHSLLWEMARTAVRREVERLFPDGIEVAREAWERDPVLSLGQSATHPVAEEGDGGIRFPLWWGGVPDRIARANATLTMSDGDPGVVTVADAPDLSGEELLVRVVADADTPLTIAIAVVREGRADVSHADLPEQFRLELIDSTLRPVMSRTSYLRTVAGQWAFVGVASHRSGDWELGNPWWEAAADVYGQEAVARAGARAEVSPAAEACREAVRFG